MPIGDTIKGALRWAFLKPVAYGSIQSDWMVANTSAATANSSAELLNPASTNDSNVNPITVPKGATRVLLRLRYDDATTTCTTAPKVVLATLDENGVPQRIDNIDSDAAGTTVGVADAADPTLVMTDGTYFYSDVTTLNGYDMLGDKTLYVLVKTAANYSGGTPAVAVMVKFLN